jgi:hypothetical protein
MHPVPLEGRLQRHMTRGGVRWLRPGCRDVHPLRSGPSRVVLARRYVRRLGFTAAAPSPGCRPAGAVEVPVAVDKALKSRKASPPGATWSKPQTPRAGRRGARHLVVVILCAHPRPFACTGCGELALPGVPRALELSRARRPQNSGAAKTRRENNFVCLERADFLHSSLPGFTTAVCLI